MSVGERTRCAVAAQENAGRLKGYKANLVLFPRNSKKPKSGEATADERGAAVQLEGKPLMPLPRSKPEVETVEITEEMQARADAVTHHLSRFARRLH